MTETAMNETGRQSPAGDPSASGDIASRSPRIVVETRFGAFAFEPAQCIHFERGLFGFPQARGFALTKLPGDRLAGLMLLQSVEDAALSFVVQPYEPGSELIAAADLEAALAQHEVAREDAATLLIANLQPVGERLCIHVNLRAPLIIDSIRRLGWQHILPNEQYQIRQELLVA